MVSTNGLILRPQKYNFFFYSDKNMYKKKHVLTQNQQYFQKNILVFIIFAVLKPSKTY